MDQTNDCYLGCYNIFKNNVITINLLMRVSCVLKMKRFHILIRGELLFWRNGKAFALHAEGRVFEFRLC